MANEQDLRNALSLLKGPDGKIPFLRSGLLGGISIQDDKAYVSLVVDEAQAKTIEPIRAAVEASLLSVKGVEKALVTLTSERPPQPNAPAAPGPRAQAATAKAMIPGVKHIVAVASGKGGVGKSTVSTNLALALSKLGMKVGILDADIYGPSLPKLFGITGRPTIDENKIMQPLDGYGIKVMSIGFLIEEETPMIWRGPMVMSALQQMMREVNWGSLDVLIVDMPPGTGDAQLTMAQSVTLAGAVIVSTPQDLALLDARRGVSMFKRVEVPILGIVENMSYFLCPECGTRSDIFGHGGARHEAERLGVPFLGEVPLHIDIRERSDAGTPIVATAPESAHAKIFLGLAEALKTRLETGAPARQGPKIIIE
ncbi:MAG: Mrp/NBP35 family ATP-binding protein [Beijerinckiaceae bacterium]|nr:Mrp/NBP35 family ATP-binding protein [Beijerinckiaceae bacterium]